MLRSTTKNSVRQARHSTQTRARRFRPQLVCLEDRLPPGDVVFGGLLGRSLIEPHPSSPGALVRAEANVHISAFAVQSHAVPAVAVASPRAGDGDTHSHLVGRRITESPGVPYSRTSLAIAADDPLNQSATWEALSSIFAEAQPPRRSPFPPATVASSAAGATSVEFLITSGSAASFTPSFAAAAVEQAPFISAAATLPPVPSPIVPGENAGGEPIKTPHVHPLFDLSSPETGPFPSNWFTVADNTQNTGRRVNMPLPDPVTHQSD